MDPEQQLNSLLGHVILNSEFNAYLFGCFCGTGFRMNTLDDYFKKPANDIIHIDLEFVNFLNSQFTALKNILSSFREISQKCVDLITVYDMNIKLSSLCTNFSNENIIAYLRGLIDINSFQKETKPFSYDKDESQLSVFFEPCKFLLFDNEFSNNLRVAFEIPIYCISFCMHIYGCNIVDFLAKLYSKAKIYLKSNHQWWLNFQYSPLKELKRITPTEDQCIGKAKICLSKTGAVMPAKARACDVGYDLTIIEKLPNLIAPLTYLYDTGVKVQPPDGFYTVIVGRSSISKTGYRLANSVGIIDPAYRGNLLVALTATNENVKPLELPNRICQFIFRKQYNFELELVKEDELFPTVRGDSGFGSSGNKEEFKKLKMNLDQ